MVGGPTKSHSKWQDIVLNPTIGGMFGPRLLVFESFGIGGRRLRREEVATMRRFAILLAAIVSFVPSSLAAAEKPANALDSQPADLAGLDPGSLRQARRVALQREGKTGPRLLARQSDGEINQPEAARILRRGIELARSSCDQCCSRR